MTGIRFLDELSAPRRSTILPSQLQSSQRRTSLQTTETTLADYVVAMAIDAPQLELYSHVAADLQRWIEHSKEIYRQAEEEAAKVTPMLFREYSTADEQMQVELLVLILPCRFMPDGLIFCVSNNSNSSRPTTTPRRDHSGTIGGCSG
jgi:kinetochore protein Spc7/SPC105